MTSSSQRRTRNSWSERRKNLRTASHHERPRRGIPSPRDENHARPREKTLSISQTDDWYAMSILERFGIQDCHPVTAPQATEQSKRSTSRQTLLCSTRTASSLTNLSLGVFIKEDACGDGEQVAPHLLPSMTSAAYPEPLSAHTTPTSIPISFYPRTAGIPIDAHLFSLSGSNRVASSHPAHRRSQNKKMSFFLCNGLISLVRCNFSKKENIYVDYVCLSPGFVLVSTPRTSF